MEKEARFLKIDLMRYSAEDLMSLLRNEILDNEERHQILCELQRRNANNKKLFQE